MKKSTNTKKARGFTIVELLVVIVVIGILAAISVVSYAGVTKKANTAVALSNASSAKEVAVYIAADSSGAFPTTAAAYTNATMVKLPAGVSISTSLLTGAAGDEKMFNAYYLTATGNKGGCIAYWDFAGNAIKYLAMGEATSTNCVAGSATITLINS